MKPNKHLRRLFSEPEGLAFVALAWVALVLGLLALLSGPAQALGITSRLPIVLDEEGRIGRIIMLYHSLAIPFVAALVYLILAWIDMPRRAKAAVQPAITAGFFLTSIGGLAFAYLGRNWLFHGIYLVGLSLVFYAGVALAVGLYPRQGDPDRLQRWAFWLMAVATLVSAIIGGAVGSFFGNGFEAILAEDIVRTEHDVFQRGIIAHLHIMLTLIDVAILLLVARITRMTKRQSRWVHGLTIAGTIIVSLATWAVIIAPFEKVAHKVINIGAGFLLPAGILVAIHGLRQLLREHAGKPLQGLLRNPARLGLYWFLVFVNLVVTVPGVYVAMNLDTYRLPEYLEVERVIAVGHWHILATLSAVMGFFLVAHLRRSESRLTRVTVWGLLIGSSAAFIFIQPIMFHPPGVSPTWPEPYLQAGIGLALTSLAVYLVAEVVAFFRGRTIEGVTGETDA